MLTMIERFGPTANDDVDQRAYITGVTWESYAAIAEARGDRPSPRLTFHEGVLELMSPSRSHEVIKTLMARLVEAWAIENDVDLNGVGSWKVENKPIAAAEPDECYILDTVPNDENDPQRPDLAIEVVWRHGGFAKLEVWRALGVPEVWVWKDDALHVFVDQGAGFTPSKGNRSPLLPTMDVDLLASFIRRDEGQLQTIRAYLAALRGQ